MLTCCYFWSAVGNCIRTDTQLQIKGRNKSARSSSCEIFCTLTLKICIMLQLLYRWQHHSRKLWIPPHSITQNSNFLQCFGN
jgi:hypothetical protein